MGREEFSEKERAEIWRVVQAHAASSSVLARFVAAYPEHGTWSRVEFVRWFCTWLDSQLDTLAPAERDGVLAAIVDTMKQAEDAIDRKSSGCLRRDKRWSMLASRSLSIGMRQRVHEISVGAPPRSLGSWVG